jgi:Lytic transglycolase
MAHWRHYVVGLFTTVGLAATASPTLAHHKPHYGVVPRHEAVSRSVERRSVEVRHHFHGTAAAHERQAGGYHPAGTITVQSAAGPITVAADSASKFTGLIADLVAHGFRGSVICAATGHVPHSLHHTGHACDFAQRGRNRTVPLMYHAGAMIAAHGLRDGCSFADCGHVDTGRPIRTARREAVVASLPPEPRPNRLMQRETWASSTGRGARSGIASWYGAAGMTAASRTLPKGSMARVTRDDGRSIVVRIADRGPFVRGRIIDLSRPAARALHIGGLAHVRVDPL